MSDWRKTHSRLAITIYGEIKQIYFKDEESKNDAGKKIAKALGSDISAGITNKRVKQATAKCKDLPVGLTETCFQQKRGVIYKFTKNGNPTGRISSFIDGKTVASYYGDKRTRKEAIDIICQKRLDWLKTKKQG